MYMLTIYLDGFLNRILNICVIKITKLLVRIDVNNNLFIGINSCIKNSKRRYFKK